METILTKRQVREFKKKGYRVMNGMLADIYVKVRFDDECGNGHNTLSVTADVYEAGYKSGRRMIMAGCCHEEVLHAFPELKDAVAFHLCSTDGPMHYVANSMYRASDKDCWGLGKGETRQIRNSRTGRPIWKLVPLDVEGNEYRSELKTYVDEDTQPPETVLYGYVPWLRIGEGEKPDLEAARSCALWPDAELADFTEEKLLERLPGLLAELKGVVESLGMIY